MLHALLAVVVSLAGPDEVQAREHVPTITVNIDFTRIDEAFVSWRIRRRHHHMPVEQRRELAHEIVQQADHYGVDPQLVFAVIQVESGFDERAVSRRGALGLMQLMPSTAAWLGVDPRDPEQNISGGAMYLGVLIFAFHGDVRLAIAAYNAGPGTVHRYRGVPPYRETRAYVQQVLSL